MNNSKRKQAFSLAETIVFVIITAIIIAATTPLLTRKIVNIQDAGSTIGGGQHGRIEIFTKEKLIFNNNEETSYEKLPSPSGPIIRVYEKIDDNTYEEIENVTPEADQNGKTIFPIVKATKIIDNKEVIYTKGKKYIFEDGKINYEEVKYIQTTNKNDKGEFIWEKAKPTENGVVLENMSPKRRVIESRLTKFDGKSIKGNNRWTVEKDNGSIKPQPWQKTYTGNKLVIDKPLLSNKADVQIPQSAANITIHAVGGGGAGGGLSENLGFKNSYEGVSDKTPDILKKQVEDNIDERIKRAEDDLAKATTKDEKHKLKVEIKRLKTLKAHVDKLKIEKGNPATNKQPKETIVVELDVQDGLAFPRDLLTYPSVLGSKTQTMQPLDLKEWFNWDTISNSGFDLTVSGFGSNGGDGGHIIQSIQDYGEDNQVSALKEFLVKNYEADCSKTLSCPVNSWAFGEVKAGQYCSELGDGYLPDDYDESQGPTEAHGCYKQTTIKEPRNKTCTCKNAKCDTKYYDCSGCDSPIKDGITSFTAINKDNNKTEGTCDEPMKAKWCDGDSGHAPVYKCAKRKEVAYEQTYDGGEGGKGGGCAVISLKATEPTRWDNSKCENSGGKGSDSRQIIIDSKKLQGYAEDVIVEDGHYGRSCLLNLTNSKGNRFGETKGGGPGLAARQDQTEYTSTNFKAEGTKINSDGHIEKDGQDMGKIDTGKEIECSINGKSCANMDFKKGDKHNATITYPLENGGSITLDGELTVGPTEPTLLDGAWYDAVLNSGVFITQESDNFTVLTDAEYNSCMSDHDYSLCTPEMLGGAMREAFSQANAKPTSSFQTQKINTVKDWVVKAINETQTYDTELDFEEGKLDGKDITENSAPCSEATLPKGAGTSNGDIKVYNELYTWVSPYATRYLGYGEAGESGEYKTTKLSNASTLEITLGRGGTWEAGNYKTGQKGQDGTPTIVKSKGRTVVNAKGGKGGTANQKTDRYTLCFADETNNCYDYNGNIVDTQKTTAEIRRTASVKSPFDKIGTFVGNSSIVGIGLGRSADGIGTSSNDDKLYGIRKAFVSSPNTASLSNYKEESKRTVSKEESGSPKQPAYYKADYFVPQPMYFKGGDGAVIITW